MSRPKRHHYVPQFLQNAFTDRQGLLHVYRKNHPELGVHAATPQNVFVERHLYSTINDAGERDPTQEIEYAKLDGPASAIVSKILTAARSDKLPKLNVEERKTWTAYLYHQMKRVPDMIDQLASKRSWTDRLLDVVPRAEAKLGRPLNDAERADIADPTFLERVKQNATVKAQADDGQVVQVLLRTMALQIGKVAGSARFLIGSRPVIRLDEGPTSHLADPNALLWFPIAPDVAVRMVFADINEQGVTLSDEQVTAINDAMFKQSSVIASGDPSLLDRFVRSTAEVVCDDR